MRFILGVDKFTPNTDIACEMAWICLDLRQRMSVV